MKTNYMVALAATSILALSPATALADGNFYLAGSIGTANLDQNFDGLDVDADSTAFRLVGGWRFNEHFSLEGGYHNFGQFEQRFANIGTPVNIGLKADGFTLGLTGTLPLGDRFGLFGRTGYFFWDGNAEINNVSQGRPEDTNLYYGAGLNFALTEQLTLLGDWSRYELEDTQSAVLSIGFSYDF